MFKTTGRYQRVAMLYNTHNHKAEAGDIKMILMGKNGKEKYTKEEQKENFVSQGTSDPTERPNNVNSGHL